MDIDADTLRTALDLVTKGSQATGSALKVIDQLKSLIGRPQVDTDKGLPKAEVEQLVMSLMTQLQDARLANIDLKEQLVELREQALKAQRSNEEFDRYELWRTAKDNLVYRLKSNEAQGSSLHFICPKCREDGTKSILQGGKYYKTCPTCKNGFDFEDSPNWS